MSSSALSDSHTLVDHLKRYPVVALVVCILIGDFALMAPAAGNVRTLASAIDQSWCWIRPFAWQSTRVDVFVLSLACSQIGLLAAWAFLSTKLRVIRALSWLVGLFLWSLAILCLPGNRHSLVNLTLLFVAQSLGVAAALTIMWRRGWQVAVPDRGIVGKAEAQAAHQYGLKDLMVFATVVGVVCMLATWLNAFWGFHSFLYDWYWNPKVWARQLMQSAPLGAMGAIAVWGCLAERRVALRITTTLVLAALVGWLTISAMVQYQNYVQLQFFTARDVDLGWPLWYTLHALLQIAVLLVLRFLGYRLVNSGARELTVRQPPRWRRWINWGARFVISIGLLAGLIYGVVVIVPTYVANRELVGATDHLGGGVYRPWNRNTYTMVIERPLDAEAAAALRKHVRVTHLEIYNLREGDGTLGHLENLPHLLSIRLSQPTASLEAVERLQSVLPNTSIAVWSRQNPK